MSTTLRISSGEEDSDIEISGPKSILKKNIKNSISLSQKRKHNEEFSDDSDSSDLELDYDVFSCEESGEEGSPEAEDGNSKNEVANIMQGILSTQQPGHILVRSNKKKKLVNPSTLEKKKIFENKYKITDLGGEDIVYNKQLKTISTVGVVQLFATIKSYKKDLDTKIEEANGEFARERALEDCGEEAFMERLDKQSRKTIPVINGEDLEIKTEIEEDDTFDPTSKKGTEWKVLSKHFYSEPTVGGWDQESSEDDN